MGLARPFVRPVRAPYLKTKSHRKTKIGVTGVPVISTRRTAAQKCRHWTDTSFLVTGMTRIRSAHHTVACAALATGVKIVTNFNDV